MSGSLGSLAANQQRTAPNRSLADLEQSFRRVPCGIICPFSGPASWGAMDERVEALLADVLALEGEDPNVIREGVRGALADCEQLFRAQEVNKRMKDKAAHACHALFRARLVEEIRLRKGTSTAEHLKLVLSIIDGPRSP